MLDQGRILIFDVKSRPIGLPVQCDGITWIYEGDTLKHISFMRMQEINVLKLELGNLQNVRLTDMMMWDM